MIYKNIRSVSRDFLVGMVVIGGAGTSWIGYDEIQQARINKAAEENMQQQYRKCAKEEVAYRNATLALNTLPIEARIKQISSHNAFGRCRDEMTAPLSEPINAFTNDWRNRLTTGMTKGQCWAQPL